MSALRNPEPCLFILAFALVGFTFGHYEVTELPKAYDAVAWSIVNKYDTDGSGGINFMEFKQIAAKYNENPGFGFSEYFLTQHDLEMFFVHLQRSYDNEMNGMEPKEFVVFFLSDNSDEHVQLFQEMFMEWIVYSADDSGDGWFDEIEKIRSDATDIGLGYTTIQSQTCYRILFRHVKHFSIEQNLPPSPFQATMDVFQSPAPLNLPHISRASKSKKRNGAKKGRKGVHKRLRELSVKSPKTLDVTGVGNKISCQAIVKFMTSVKLSHTFQIMFMMPTELDKVDQTGIQDTDPGELNITD